MRNKLGLVPITIRAKDSSTIDLTSIYFDDLEIIGNIEDAKGGKLILLDVYITDASEDAVYYKGITLLEELNSYVEVVGYNEKTSKACQIEIHSYSVIIADL